MTAIDELKFLPQWVCSKENKIPLDIFGTAASVTDPRTWDSYSNCKATDYQNVGFVLSANDPYTIIDLDAPQDETQAKRHKAIIEKFDSYTEQSVSGKGVHIIVKGKIPKGVRRDKVEIYSTERYMICTDKALNKKPIEQRQDLLDILFKEMDSTRQVKLQQIDSLITDQAVLDLAGNAVNKEKFLALCQGRMEDYPSQSEADFALLSMFAFYTRDNEQVKRLFRMSALGKRKKAERESYLNTALRKIRAKQPPPIDTADLKKALSKTDTELKKEINKEPPAQDSGGISYPPGLVGDVARYIEESSIRPVKEVGIAAALGLCAGLWGRSFNVSGTGLNQYIILLAKTGTGKDGAATGIDNVVSAMRKTLPSIERCLGPGGFASGQALLRALDKQPGFVSVLGEFGITLQQITDPRANMAQVMLKRVLLDLYARSGHGKIMRSNVYADSDKNTSMIASPAVTILGESTPETFYSGLDQEHIAEGLIPRFTIIQYNGKRPPRNDRAFFAPPNALIKEMITTATASLQLEQNYSVVDIAIDADAQKLMDNFDKHADKEINKAQSDVDAQLWNRAHLKALKLAGLVAVGVDHNAPVIDEEIALWAIKFIEQDVATVLDQFTSGKHGTGNVRQEGDLRAAFDKYLTLQKSQRMSFKVPKSLRDNGQVIPFGYLRKKLRLLLSFKADKRGEIGAIQALLNELCNEEILYQLPPTQALDEYKTRQALYVRGKNW